MKERIWNLALAASVSLLVLAALEGVCRWREQANPPEPVAEYLWDWQQRWDGDFYVFDSDAVGWPPWEEFNADGVRDRAHAVEKPEGVHRIVFLGDSVTLGDHIKREQAFPQRLEARFDEEGRPVEVFNIALLGWSTRQERLAYERIARRYQPDEVILAVCLNDIAELQNNLTRPAPWLVRWHERSALVRAIVDARSREIKKVEELFLQGDSTKVREALGRFFDEVKALREQVEKDRARLKIVVFPFRFQVRAGAPAPTVQAEIRRFASQERIPIRDLLRALSPLGDRAFVDYDHLSPEGAQAAADEMVGTGFLDLPERAADTFAAVGLPESPDARSLLRLLQDADPGRRAAAAWGLGRLAAGGAEVEAVLTDRLRHDASERVRANGALALGSRKSKAAVPALFEALADERAAVRWRAASALYGIEPPFEVALPQYVQALENPDPYVRAFATWSLGNLGEKAAPAVPALVKTLSQPDAFAQGGAVLALGKIGTAARDAVPVLVRALGSPDLGRRRTAARALGRLGPGAEDAVPALLEAAGDPDDSLRAMAVRALAHIAPERPEVMLRLRDALRDSAAEVRRQAKLAQRDR